MSVTHTPDEIEQMQRAGVISVHRGDQAVLTQLRSYLTVRPASTDAQLVDFLHFHNGIRLDLAHGHVRDFRASSR